MYSFCHLYIFFHGPFYITAARFTLNSAPPHFPRLWTNHPTEALFSGLFFCSGQEETMLFSSHCFFLSFVVIQHRTTPEGIFRGLELRRGAAHRIDAKRRIMGRRLCRDHPSRTVTEPPRVISALHPPPRTRNPPVLPPFFLGRRLQNFCPPMLLPSFLNFYPKTLSRWMASFWSKGYKGYLKWGAEEMCGVLD